MEEQIVQEGSSLSLPVLVTPLAGRSRLSSPGMLQTPLLPSILESSGGDDIASEAPSSVQRGSGWSWIGPDGSRRSIEDLTKVERLIYESWRSAKLDLSRCSLTELDTRACEVEGLKNMFLHHNKLQTLPARIGSCRSLIHLKIQNNIISSLPPQISALVSLQLLTLNNNNLRSLPLEIGSIQSLRFVDASFNKLVHLPITLSNCFKLERIVLVGNPLNVAAIHRKQVSVPVELQVLSKELNLVGNHFTFLPPRLGQLCTVLTALRCSDYIMKKLSDPPGHITSRGTTKTLEYLLRVHLGVVHCNLRLDGWGIDQLTVNFLNLDMLRVFDAKDNALTALPVVMGKLTCLTKLCVARNQLSQLPYSFSNLVNMQCVDVSWNKLPRIPLPLTNMTSMTSLDLSYNQIKTFSAAIEEVSSSTLDEQISAQVADKRARKELTSSSTIGGSLWKIGGKKVLSKVQTTKAHVQKQRRGQGIFALRALLHMDLTGNALSVLPSSISLLTALQSLKLAKNQLNFVPPEICYLRNLQIFFLEDNRLEGIPVRLCEIPVLKELNLRNNLLLDIPPEIGQMTCLKSLIVNTNKIQSLPPGMQTLERTLEELDFAENNILEPPNEVLREGKIGTFGYLKLIRLAEASRSLVLDHMRLNHLALDPTPLTALTHLSLVDNELPSMPSILRSFTRLEFLNLSRNRIELLEDYISCFVELKELVLSENRIKKLPGCIGALASLTSLSLDLNQLDAEAVAAWILDHLVKTVVAKVLRRWMLKGAASAISRWRDVIEEGKLCQAMTPQQEARLQKVTVLWRMKALRDCLRSWRAGIGTENAEDITRAHEEQKGQRSSSSTVKALKRVNVTLTRRGSIMMSSDNELRGYRPSSQMSVKERSG